MARTVSAAYSAELLRAPSWLVRVTVADSLGTVLLTTETDAPTGQQIVVDQARVAEDESRLILGDSDVLVRSSALPGSVDDLVPQEPGDLLAPTSGATVAIQSGLRLADGSVEWVPVVTHSLDETVVEHTPEGIALRLTCLDLSARVDDARFTDPYEVAAGTNVVTAIEALVESALGSDAVEINADSTSHTTPALTFAEQDSRWEAVQRLAESVGMRARFDAEGTLRIERPATLDSSVTNWIIGPDRRPLSGGANVLSRRKTYNGVIARGDNLASDDPVPRGEAWDTDPESPTYYDPAGGSTSFGAKPLFYVSEFLATDAQAQAAAEARLAKVKGLVQTVSLSLPLDPAIEVGDVIEVPWRSIGVDGRMLVERREHTLQGDALKTNLICQERRLP